MPRYINVNKQLIRLYRMNLDCGDVIKEFLVTAEQEEVVKVKRGKWINRSLNICYPEWERYTCSECGKHADSYDFCPNCGADMRGGDENVEARRIFSCK